MSTEKSAAEQLGELLRDANAQVQIGLRQQGKFDTVRRMLAEGRSHRDIGAAIGWDGKAAVEWFAREAADELSRPSPTLARVQALVTRWRDAAAWETESGDPRQAGVWDQCADELAAALEQPKG